MIRQTTRQLITLLEQCALAGHRSNLARFAAGRFALDAMMAPMDYLRIRKQYAYRFGRPPCLLFPQTFNEKLQRSKLTRRRKRYTVFADKLAVRNYVTEQLGSQYLTRLLWNGTSLSDCHLIAELPNCFMIKTNHGCGGNIACYNKADFDWNAASSRVNVWLQQNHSTRFSEWQYRWINPQVFIEELLLNDRGEIPSDYKFWCFGGAVKIIQADYDRATNHQQLFLNRQFEPLDVHRKTRRFTGVPTRPGRLDEMIAAAERLAKREEFVRVDLYDLPDRVVFGELTLHPDAGLEVFNPPEFDQSLAALMR